MANIDQKSHLSHSKIFTYTSANIGKFFLLTNVVKHSGTSISIFLVDTWTLLPIDCCPSPQPSSHNLCKNSKMSSSSFSTFPSSLSRFHLRFGRQTSLIEVKMRSLTFQDILIKTEAWKTQTTINQISSGCNCRNNSINWTCRNWFWGMKKKSISLLASLRFFNSGQPEESGCRKKETNRWKWQEDDKLRTFIQCGKSRRNFGKENLPRVIVWEKF